MLCCSDQFADSVCRLSLFWQNGRQENRPDLCVGILYEYIPFDLYLYTGSGGRVYSYDLYAACPVWVMEIIYAAGGYGRI